jgi:hypothetical protein
MIRQEIELGPFPSSLSANIATIDRQHALLQRVLPPLSDDEARKLIMLFGPDDYFGGAWTLLHLIESSPGWPLNDCLSDQSNEWIARLRQRCGQ